MTTWFTADHHFGHAKIIEICHRPFANVDDMDKAMIDRWNAVVGAEDDVWHLGDFAYRCGPNRMGEIFRALNGRALHLVGGNHDRKHALALPWTTIHQYVEHQLGDRMLVLFHYPLRDWNKAHHGSWCLHGHGHAKLPPMAGTCDVGVDAWDFRPVSLPEIEASLGRIRPS